jgi:hypothetical protein
MAVVFWVTICVIHRKSNVFKEHGVVIFTFKW